MSSMSFFWTILSHYFALFWMLSRQSFIKIKERIQREGRHWEKWANMIALSTVSKANAIQKRTQQVFFHFSGKEKWRWRQEKRGFDDGEHKRISVWFTSEGPSHSENCQICSSFLFSLFQHFFSIFFFQNQNEKMRTRKKKKQNHKEGKSLSTALQYFGRKREKERKRERRCKKT